MLVALGLGLREVFEKQCIAGPLSVLEEFQGLLLIPENYIGGNTRLGSLAASCHQVAVESSLQKI